MLHRFLDNFVVVFIDDIVIYSKIEEEDKCYLRLMLESLRKNKFYAKLKKCELWLSKVAFLGNGTNMAPWLILVRCLQLWTGRDRLM
jgi:hypothetical protein